MANLSSFTFTSNSDLATSINGWELKPPSGAAPGKVRVVNTLAGDDIISNTSSIYGIALGSGNASGGGGTLNTDAGNDSISSTVSGNLTSAIGVNILSSIITGGENDSISGLNNGFSGRGIVSSGLIDTGDGDDSITGTSNGNRDSAGFGAAIDNTGTIVTGIGNDSINGSGIWSFGIVNFGTINTGDGIDTITGSGTGFYGTAIRNADSSNTLGVINTGAGEDSITGTSSGTAIDNDGSIITADGNDSITGTSTGSSDVDFGYGIINYYGIIDTGIGNDTITGSGFGLGGYGIFNANTIKTGSGRDVVDALIGGFGGSGLISLGNGNDTIKGFAADGSVATRGIGSFDGGIGTDRLLIGAAGTYSVSSNANPDGFYELSNGSDSMLIKGFEFLGNANTGQTIAFAAEAVFTI